MQHCLESQKDKPFSIEQFAQRMSQFIIKRNVYKGAKESVRESNARIQSLMQKIREAGTATVAG